MIIPMLVGQMVPQNATGWNELFNGHILTAAYVMYDEVLMGWTVLILFIVYQLMLYLKTRNITLSWVTGVFFAALFVSAKLMDATGSPILKPIAIQFIFVLLVIELAAIIYMWFK
jgi:hypothetical protein